MNSDKDRKRIAINVGDGFVPGLNSVVMGAAIAAGNLGWEVVGIRDGFDGILFPDRYPEGGFLPLELDQIERMDPVAGNVLGQSSRFDPFHVRQVSEEGFVDEADLSDQVLETLRAKGIDALISVAGGRALSILYKLNRKGLNTICIPRSVENDIAATEVSYGFNSTLSFTIEMLDRSRQAAQSARQIAVVEVLGEQAGWIALQAGIAAGADAILIPEITADLGKVADHLKAKMTSNRAWGLVVVAAGARFADTTSASDDVDSSMRSSLSPLATGSSTGHAIQRSGKAAEFVANKLQMMLAEPTHPLVLGSWARGGAPTAVDRQLGVWYGAGAVRALNAGTTGAMLAFQPPNIEAVPLQQAINQVRTVPFDSEMILAAQSLGICLGEASHDQ